MISFRAPDTHTARRQIDFERYYNSNGIMRTRRKSVGDENATINCRRDPAFDWPGPPRAHRSRRLVDAATLTALSAAVVPFRHGSRRRRSVISRLGGFFIFFFLPRLYLFYFLRSPNRPSPPRVEQITR